LACLYLFPFAFGGLIALIPGPSHAFRPLQHLGLLFQWALYFTVYVTLSVGLLRMRNWSRWLAITFSVVQLLFGVVDLLFVRYVRKHSVLFQWEDEMLNVGIGLRILFAVCVIWYLTRPHVKTAFQSG